METTETKRKTRTITLTDARPVKIYEDEWSIVAQARDWNGEHESQANRIYSIRVREHADGRRIVHGSRQAGNGGIRVDERESYGGRLIPAINDGKPDESATIDAIHFVCELIDAEQLGAECIADLPAQEI